MMQSKNPTTHNAIVWNFSSVPFSDCRIPIKFYPLRRLSGLLQDFSNCPSIHSILKPNNPTTHFIWNFGPVPFSDYRIPIKFLPLRRLNELLQDFSNCQSYNLRTPKPHNAIFWNSSLVPFSDYRISIKFLPLRRLNAVNLYWAEICNTSEIPQYSKWFPLEPYPQFLRGNHFECPLTLLARPEESDKGHLTDTV